METTVRKSAEEAVCCGVDRHQRHRTSYIQKYQHTYVQTLVNAPPESGYTRFLDTTQTRESGRCHFMWGSRSVNNPLIKHTYQYYDLLLRYSWTDRLWEFTDRDPSFGVCSAACRQGRTLTQTSVHPAAPTQFGWKDECQKFQGRNTGRTSDQGSLYYCKCVFVHVQVQVLGFFFFFAIQRIMECGFRETCPFIRMKYSLIRNHHIF